MKRWFRNRFMVGIGLFIILSIVVYSIGSIAMKGENPIKLGVSLWYLNETEKEVLRIAGDDRFVTFSMGMEENILEYLPRLDKVSRGEWKITDLNKESITYEEANQGIKVVIHYHFFMDNYSIFDYAVLEK